MAELSMADHISAGEGEFSEAPASSRLRSASPWQFKFSPQPASLLRGGESDGVSGVSTPVQGRGAGYPRAASGTRTGLQASVQAQTRASYESALLAAVRRQLETFEERVTRQLSMSTGQQANTQRLEERVGQLEGLQPKMDRRIAELTGNIKGLSDEMQAQIRRVDVMDERLWEWRRQVDEDLRQKHIEFDQHIQKVSSSARSMGSAFEEDKKRHALRSQRFEENLEEHRQGHEEMREGIMALHSRLEFLESSHVPHAIRALPTHAGALVPSGAAVESIAIVEGRLADTSDRLAKMVSEWHEFASRMQSQEEKLKALQTRVDSYQGNVRERLERIERGDAEGRLEQISKSQQDDSRLRQTHQEHLEVLTRRLEHHDQAYEELRSNQEHLRRSGGAGGGALFTDADPQISDALAEIQARVEAIEVHASSGGGHDDGLHGRMGMLISKLHELAPKIDANVEAVSELRAARDVTAGELMEIKTKVGHQDIHAVGDRLSPAESDRFQEVIDNLREIVPMVRDHNQRLLAPGGSTVELGSQMAQMAERLVRTEAEVGKMGDRLEPLVNALGALNADIRAKGPGQPEGETSVVAFLQHLEPHKEELRAMGVSVSSLKEATSDVSAMREQLHALGASVDAVRELHRATSEGATQPAGAGMSTELTELLEGAKQDDEKESEAYKRVVSRVDELVDRLQDVTRLVTAIADQGSGATGGTGCEVVAAPEGLNELFESLASKVESSERRAQEVENQMQAKVLELYSAVEKLQAMSS